MGAKGLLFAYGLLQPGRAAPRSLTRHWPDRVRGRLYDLGAYPGLVKAGDPSEDWIEGVTLEIDVDELPVLDEFEDIESGEFRRILVTTESGYLAWVYEYGWEIPKAARALSKWALKP